ncbi:TNF receptor-associated factor 2-like [Branchiostoma floridae x Branchiostoma japonicum]
MPGYVPDLFLDDVSSYTCVVCGLVVKQAWQTDKGDRYCKTCESQEYPQRLRAYYDKATDREVQALRVLCTDDTCRWSGALKDYQDHRHNCHTPRQLYNHYIQGLQQQISQSLQDVNNRIQQLSRQSPRPAPVTTGNHERALVLGPREASLEGMRILTVLNREMEESSGRVEALEQQHRQERETFKTLEKKVESLQRMLVQQQVALAEQDLRIQTLELNSYDGILTWKIPDFAHKRHDAITGKTASFYSPCFFTSRTGYKMCARIYLNGDGMGKDTHVSLFFVVMRGHYDGLLRWPFRQKLTFMLLDQNNHKHVTDAFRPDPTSSSFQRPTSDMNIASGCPLFVPLSQLDSSSHGYVRDDTMFLKIIVDTSDL